MKHVKKVYFKLFHTLSLTGKQQQLIQ